MNQDRVIKRYYKEFSIAMGIYIITVIASVNILTRFDPPQFARIIIVLTPVVPTVFVFIAIMRAVLGSDELQQKIQFNAIMFSATLTGLITFSYGFLEGIGFPKMPTILVLPLMFVLWGLGLGYFTRRYQ